MDGTEIRKLRKDKRLSLAEVAAKVGVSVSSVQRWESSTEPLARHVAPLEAALGLRPGYFARQQMAERKA